MDVINVSLEDLLSILEQVKQDGYEVIEISMLEAFNYDDGEHCPASLHVSGVERDYLGVCDYEPIDAIDLVEYRK